jgi:hypothetical protein
MSSSKLTGIAPDSKLFFFEEDGRTERASYSFYRGEHANFHPTDEGVRSNPSIVKSFVEGLMPPRPFLHEKSFVVAFGSCFAAHISSYLRNIGFAAAAEKAGSAYISTMGDGIVNTYALRQQFEWAWEAKTPTVELWHGYDAKALGYDENVRRDTKEMLDNADTFILTLGLSEVWYDEPTGEVFWRAVPVEHFDPSRHKFRAATYQENLDNLDIIYSLIRHFRPTASIVLTLSPIPLKATFRRIPCVAANSASKAILRAGLDEFIRRRSTDENLFYFPSYEIVLGAFEHPFMEDRRHVHKHVLDLNMAVFERYFCKTGLTDERLLQQYRAAQAWDLIVCRDGHWAVPRANLLFHDPPLGAKVFDPAITRTC